MNFVFDIDGTICNNGRYIDPNIEKAILELSKTRNVIFASARPIRDMLPLIDSSLHKSLLIGCNGGIHYKDGSFGKTRYFKKEQIIRVIEFIKNNDMPYVLDSDWFFSLSEKKHMFHDYIRSLSNYELSEKKLISKGVTKLLILENKFKNKLIKYLNKQNILYSLNHHTQESFF